VKGHSLAHALFNIAVAEENVTPVHLPEEGDFTNYCEQILNDLISDKRRKSFKFRDVNEIVPSSISKVLEDTNQWSAETLRIAEKLLSVEIEAQRQIQAMNKNIQKGALFLLLVSHENRKIFVVLKIDHSSFFDEIEARYKQGLPVSKQRLQKSCLVCMDQDESFDDIFISDSGSGIREYWWRHFLATEELQSSELNTKNAFNSIDRFLRKEVKKDSPADYWYMRNDVISYFRNNDQFAFDEVIEKFRDHRPESDTIREKMDEMITKFEKLPKSPKTGFDTQFNLEPNIIKAKIKKTIVLDENFELRITGEVDNLRNKITPDIDGHGKYIKIYSDVGYVEFGGQQVE
ncbi:nucleoid-associated protein, partial [Dickeya dianthicola]|uniref:nucleoid-associated protein n=1 Tax=Dickeya dianthicola TaxID=204039 RepID=UPI00136D52DC